MRERRIGTLVAVRTKGSIRAAALVLVLAAACSGGSNGPGPAPLVEKSYAISTGDAICKQLVADIKTTVSGFKSTHANFSEGDARDFLVNTLLARIDRGVGDIHRVGEPTKDKPQYDDAIHALDADLSTLKEAVGADPVKVVNNPIPLFSKSTKPFADYGFTVCGKTT